ncbi:hypothetical protein [Kribbella jiaozuonensis]|uniref:Uncharacterized protein n=1 Tax=Kribbella jiaozuonensis TaxID=2575441 RepID=A0A4U3LZX0_9ACTN|nr:hypothetical protein [Kribbella jiaozuonensis]TKK81791.1 hypothetical protein FDA38_02890 [Kribbella jiaozuonensis]
MTPTVRWPSGLLAQRVTIQPAVIVSGTRKKSSATTAPPNHSGNLTRALRSSASIIFQTPHRPIGTPTVANPMRVLM